MPTSPGLTLAVVIPTLNEPKALPGLLRTLANQTRPAERLVVADGGSTDGTADLAREAGASVVAAPGRGRGGQVAVAVAGLTEDAVLVAHADMLFPPDALARLADFLRDHPDCPGGCLGHRFDRRTMALRLVEWWDRRRARRGESYGDQAQFFRREMLAKVGGFPDQPIMEDVELSRRLRMLGQPAYLDLPVTVSARRFEKHGLLRTVRFNWRARRRYRREGSQALQSIYNDYYRASS